MKQKLSYKNSLAVAATALAFLLAASSAFAQTSGFSYQGKLTDGGTAANGSYDLQFALWDSLSGGTQIGSTQAGEKRPGRKGGFSPTLHFWAARFPSAHRKPLGRTPPPRPRAVP